jgi:hypothetical protein
MATPQELQRLIQELESKINNLAPNNAGFRQTLDLLKQSSANASQLTQNIDAANQLLGSVNKEISDLNDQLGYTFKSFQAIINELTRGKTNIGNINKGVKSLTDTTQKLVNRQTEYGKLTYKQLKTLRDQTYLAFENLKAERLVLEQRIHSGTLSAEQLVLERMRATELDGILKANIGLEQSLKNQLVYALQEQKAVEETLGLTGNLLKALSSLPGLASISQYLNVAEATEEMEKFSQKLIDAVKESDGFKGKFAALQTALDIEKDDVAEIDELLKNINLTDAQRLQLLAQREAGEGRINDLVAQQAKLNKEATLVANNFIGKVLVGIKGLTELTKGFYKAVTDPATIFTVLAKGVSQISKDQASFQRNLGISADDAGKIRDRFERFALAQSDSYFTTTKLIAAQAAYNEALGFSGRISESNAKAQIRMTDMIGVSAEASNQLRYFAESTGEDLNDQLVNQKAITKQVSIQYGVALQFKGVAETVAKASSYTRVQFKGSTEALTAAVAEAKLLGTTIESTQKSAKALMQFETSIQNELEAELLTGRQLNLEQARYYALTNNVAGLTRELVTNAGSYNEFIEMNAIQQESIAAALGKEASEISDILFMEQFRGLTRDQALAQMDDEAEKRYEALDLQQRFAGLVEKIQTTLVNMAPGLETIANIFNKMLGSAEGVYVIMGLLATSMVAKLITSFTALGTVFRGLRAASLGIAVGKAWGAAMSSPAAMLTGGIAGLALGGIITAAIMSSVDSTEAKDLFSSAPGGGGSGKRMLLGPEGAFSLSNKDNILATTNPIPVNDMRTVSTTGGQQLQPIQVVVNSILDSQRIGQGMELAKYKTSA